MIIKDEYRFQELNRNVVDDIDKGYAIYNGILLLLSVLDLILKNKMDCTDNSSNRLQFNFQITFETPIQQSNK